jgi:hypothetical protein
MSSINGDFEDANELDETEYADAADSASAHRVMQRTLGLLTGGSSGTSADDDASTVVTKSKTGEEQIWEQVMRVVLFILMFQWVGHQEVKSSSSVQHESAARHQEPSATP